MDNSRISSMSMVSKTLYSHFFDQGLLQLHTRLDYTSQWNHELNLRSLWVSLCMALTQTQLLCVVWRYRLWAACPCLSWSADTFIRSIVVELDSEGYIVSFSLNIRAYIAHVQIWNVHVHVCILSFNLNFRYMATLTGHTHASSKRVI